MMSRIVIVAAAGVLAASLYAASKPVTVELKDAKGADVGSAKISGSGAGVLPSRVTRDVMCTRSPPAF